MIYLTSPNARFEIRRIPVHHYRIGTERVLSVTFVADSAVSDGRFACSIASRLQLSLDGGANYNPVGTAVQSGLSLGAFTTGQRKDAKIKVVAPLGASFHTEVIELYIGSGV